jgi:PAS domain S-box-containing protein
MTPGSDTVKPGVRYSPGPYAAVAALAIGAWALLPAGAVSGLLFLLVNALVVVSLFIGLQRHRPSARTGWVVLGCAQVCSVAAFVFWYLLPLMSGKDLPVPSPVDGLFMALYAGNCIAIALFIRGERSGSDRETLLDVLIVAVSLGALSWVFLMQPYAQDANLGLAVKLVSLAYPAMDLLLVILTLRLAFSGSTATPAKALLVAWACLQLAGDTTYGVLVLMGQWTLASPVFLLWMAGFGCLAAAARHPTMATLGTSQGSSARGTRPARRVIVAAAVLALPVLLTVRLVQGSPDNLLVITSASVLVCLLALARGAARGNTRTTRSDRLALVRLTAIFAVCALLPLGLLAGSSIRLSERAVESDARERVRATSAASADLVEIEMGGVAQLVQSYAQRELLRLALGDGSSPTVDAVALRRHLAQLDDASEGVSGAFVTDPSGRLHTVVPSSPAIVGEDFSYRDWYRGAIANGGEPYVSEAYESRISGADLVVAVATVIRRPEDGEPLAVLAVVYDLTTIQGFSDELSEAQGVSLRITDQRGMLVGAPSADGDQFVGVKDENGIAGALRGQDRMGTVLEARGAEVLSAVAPVPGLGWTVSAQVPTATAFASLGLLRSTVLGIAVLLGQVLLAGLVLLARAQRERREALRRLSEREEATRGILEAAADAFIAIDADGVVTAWSPQSELLFGWTASEACGRALATLIVPPDLRDSHLAGLAQAADARGSCGMLGRRTELPALHRDGRRFPVELVMWQSSTGGHTSFNAFVHDISDRKEHEAQLATARDEALDASRAKTEFLAVMSHELRTPMNGVMGMTSLLLATSLSPQQRDYAKTVRSSADSLLGLLNDVLDLSKVEADRLELELVDFDLGPVVSDAVHLLAGSARLKDVTLAADIDDDVPRGLRGDPARLRQVLLNLIGNALKFTPSGSVHLRVRVDASSGSDSTAADEVRLRFEIVDTGIGIAAESRPQLFDAFSQADSSTTRLYGGTGLGLAISKSLVALFGGQIGVESELGVGSTFWFTARFGEAAHAVVTTEAEPAPATRVRPATPGLVLVVDDNATNQKVAVHMLELLGHSADVAASGVEAVEACARGKYDLVLMDCRMPLMDGYEATLVIRSVEGAGDRTPIVAMTASAMVADQERCLEVGMDGYLSKPVRLADLAAQVDLWIRPDLPSAAGPGHAPDADADLHADRDSRTPVLDEAQLAELASLGPDVMAELVPVFLSDTRERLAEVRAAVRSGDALGQASAAHALRGSAANMGGTRVTLVCRRLEEAGRTGRLTDAPADLLRLETEVDAMVQAIQTRVAEPV